MAQTWPVSGRRIAGLKFVDIVGRTLASPFRFRRPAAEPINNVLVIEPWNIGDVVLVTPLLIELRERLPQAKVALLARDYARDLLEGSGLVDEIVEARLPWTAQKNKYRMTAPVVGEIAQLIAALRRRRFDLTIDARMDIRSNLLAALTGARRRIGYGIGGGGWLLTDTLLSQREDSHKIDDWLALVELISPATGAREPQRVRPKLVVSDQERARARQVLSKAAGSGAPTIGYHPGGSHPGKRWPLFGELIADLQRSAGGRHLVFHGPDETATPEYPDGAVVMRPSLRELMAQISCCDVLVCNDSGPMHIADALGVAVVAIFEVGNPQWFGPSGVRSRVVRGELAGTGMSAAPLDRPPVNPVQVDRVASAVMDSLGSTD